MSYKVVDLFCGAGGLSRGFMDAGFDIVLGVDFNDKALETFEANHGGAEAFKLDLFDLDNISKIRDKLASKKIDDLDVLIGGPPCQGFSLAGNRVESDERNKLYTAMVETAKQLKPKVILLENVPGLIKLYDGKVANKIVDDFSSLGYSVKKKVLYAPNYGVPQIRKRVFFVAVKNGLPEFEFPQPLIDDESKFISCEDAISDLPPLIDIKGDIIQDYPTKPLSDYQKKMRKKSKEIHNHIGTIHTEKTKKMISMVPEGKNYKALPEKYRAEYTYHESLTRYHSKRPSRTIDTGHRTHFHYKLNRIPTVRESARLQSFPDDFIFLGNKADQYKQVGNAVPPLLGKALAESILSLLKKGT
ncbi:DNA cytosine methyltransferase [Breznakia pachnodae]|uniref:Cytosine-specific methyltransferase n=1 Tax=Breznakia pachnodae TaxID=265178 RepID=A0ABU0E635_9FIRM|nr:DNA cytosine methyltransferase [Breznakia pachnodae]MDQ0362181.1 DNA (cytosine-5)-methyltransferase 1 [Breznakia pachnodae]